MKESLKLKYQDIFVILLLFLFSVGFFVLNFIDDFPQKSLFSILF